MQYKITAVQNLADLWNDEWQPKLDAALEEAPATWRFALRPILKLLNVEGLLESLDDNPERLDDIKGQLEKALTAITMEERDAEDQT